MKIIIETNKNLIIHFPRKNKSGGSWKYENNTDLLVSISFLLKHDLTDENLKNLKELYISQTKSN